MPRPTQGSTRTLRLRGCHPLWPAFPDRSASSRWTTGLLPFRSPLLRESRLMSFPPGTEMFQFPGFASGRYGFTDGYPRRGGLPHSDMRGSTLARSSPRLIAACHVLHRLLPPRHPPDALLTRPGPVPPPPPPTPLPGQLNGRRRRTGPTGAPLLRRLTTTHARPNLSLHPAHGAQTAARPHPPPSPCQRADTTVHSTDAGAPLCARTRRSIGRSSGAPAPQGHGHEQTDVAAAAAGQQAGWRRPDSNRRPPACKAGALPLSYAPAPSAPDGAPAAPHPANTALAATARAGREGRARNGPGRT